jgi:hypothetical protein
MSRAFGEILGVEPTAGAGNDLRAAARAAGRPLPDEVGEQECSLCLAQLQADGFSRGNGPTFEFESEVLLPKIPVGAEVRLKCRQGSLRCLVLRADERCLRLARAPNRCERRRHPRFHVEGVAVVHFSSDHEAEARIRDISEGGTGVVSGCLLEVGAPVRLFLRISGLKKISYEVEGWVANCKPNAGDGYCIGIQFQDLPEDLKQEIRRLHSPQQAE